MTINCCGYQKFSTKNFTKHRVKGRLDFLIIYLANGKMSYIKNNVRKTISEGTILIYYPHEEQHCIYLFEENPEAYWIHFTGYGCKSLLDTLELSEQRELYLGTSLFIINLFKNIINELQIKRPYFHEMTKGLFTEMISFFARRTNYKKYNYDDNTTKIKRVIEMMHNEYNQNLTLKYFADKCNLSKCHFNNIFKHYTQLSPIEYFINIRMEKAKELLVDPYFRINEISEIIGYENPMFFSRIFKKKFGITPSQYRKNNTIHD